MELEHLKGWFTSEEKFLKTPVGIFLLGAFLSQLVPDPTDAIHYWLQEHVLNNPHYSATVRAVLQIFDWNFMSASYVFILLILAYFLHIKNVGAIKRITLIAAILSVGAAVGIVAQFLIGS
jgi:hypothetical protein